MNWESPYDFAKWFVESFITPLFDVLQNQKLLGITLYEWFFGFLVLGLAATFFQAFFGNRNFNEKG